MPPMAGVGQHGPVHQQVEIGPYFSSPLRWAMTSFQVVHVSLALREVLFKRTPGDHPATVPPPKASRRLCISRTRPSRRRGGVFPAVGPHAPDSLNIRKRPERGLQQLSRDGIGQHLASVCSKPSREAVFCPYSTSAEAICSARFGNGHPPAKNSTFHAGS